jgi:predicted Zn-ribbon and HTH transcriptional regulator
MNTKLERAWTEAEKNPGTRIDIGRIVVCDFCSDDHTDSDATGGLIFGSYAICPKCVHKVQDESSRINARCPEGTSFGDFVRQYRGGNNTISITPVEAPKCRECKQLFSDKNVHTSAGWKETRISGICEDCFDAMFAGDDA